MSSCVWKLNEFQFEYDVLAEEVNSQKNSAKRPSTRSGSRSGIESQTACIHFKFMRFPIPHLKWEIDLFFFCMSGCTIAFYSRKNHLDGIM